MPISANIRSVLNDRYIGAKAALHFQSHNYRFTPIRDAQKKGLLHMDIRTGAYSYSAVKVIICNRGEANFYKIPSHLYERNA